MAQTEINLGDEFGRWEVVGPRFKKGKHWYRLCKCKCEIIKPVRESRLLSGETSQCSDCAHTTHGKCYTRVYCIWYTMIQRCTNPKAKKYSNYGGRGITVCNKWKTFEGFYQDMGDPPTDKHTLDRKNNDLGYSKGNCRWATPIEQGRNTRRNRMITYQGQTKCIAEWASITKINERTIHNRIYRSGWPVERALTEPPKSRSHDN